MSNVKGAARSKGMIGALVNLAISIGGVAAAAGWLPLGITFDAQTGDVTLNVYNVAGALVAGGLPGSAILMMIGRWVAKGPIRGLW